MSINPSLARDPGLIYHDTTSVDLINFAGNLSFELCKFGEEWLNIFNRAKYSSLLLLFGAGGAYLLLSWKSKGRFSSSPSSRPNFFDRSFLKWLLGEELVEGEDGDIDHVHGYYFGPSLSVNDNLGSPNDADEEMDSDNLSLNSLSAPSSPYKFFQRPLSKANNQMMKNLFSVRQKILNPCPKCEKGICRLKKHQRRKNYSSSSSCYSDSPKAQRRTSSIDILKSDNDKILQRTVAFNTLTHRFYRPGLDLRMRGDGSEETNVLLSNKDTRANNYDGIKNYLPSCGDIHCTEPTCNLKYPLNRDWSTDSIGDNLGISMLELVRNAKETRRLIRDISMDSETSDIEILYEQSVLDSLDFSECDPLEELPASDEFDIDEELPKHQLRERDFWRLTGFNEEGSGNMESSDIENQSLEWDSPPGWSSNSKNKSIIQRKISTISLNEIASFDETNLDGYEWDDNGIDEIPEGDDFDFADHTSNADGSIFSMSNLIGDNVKMRRTDNFQVSNNFFYKEDQTSIAQELPRSRELLPNNMKMYSGEPVLSGQPSPDVGQKEFASLWPTLSENDGLFKRSVTSYSDESGFLDGDGNMNISNHSTSSMNSSIFTNSIDLSPVKEMREPQVRRNRGHVMDQNRRLGHISTSSSKNQ